jgi:hypothetical protein
VSTTISNEHVEERRLKGAIMESVTESPIKVDTNPVTARGYVWLCQELRRMCAEHRQEMDEQLLQAPGKGTLEDNPELLGLSWENARAWGGE